MTVSVTAWSPAIHSLPSKTINAKIHRLTAGVLFLSEQISFYM